MERIKVALLGLGICMLSLFGCGGSGGSGSSLPGGTVSTFATDNMNAGFSHVWAKIKKIELTSATGPATIFDESATGGRIVDLRTLRDATGARFVLLSNASVAAGSYTGANVTMDKNLSVVATGSATATDAVFAGATGSEKMLTVTFRAPINPATRPKVVIDFDLSTWNLAAGVVTATGDLFAKHGRDDGIGDSSRHEQDDYSGTVSALAGTPPVQTFTITKGGRSINVATDASTVIFNNNGTDNPAITNGLKVEVTGVFDTTASVLKASRVKLEQENESDNEAKVEGVVSAFSETLGQITANIDDADGFVPQATTAVVTTNDTTRFFGPSGILVTKSEFYALLVSNITKIEAEGISTSGIGITAKRVKIEDGEKHGGGGGDSHHEAELKGTVSNLNADAKTFDLTVSRWEGVALTVGKVVKVTAKTIPAGILNGVRVEAKGNYDAQTSTLVAERLKLDD
jgi:hypothetical protein